MAATSMMRADSSGTSMAMSRSSSPLTDTAELSIQKPSITLTSVDDDSDDLSDIIDTADEDSDNDLIEVNQDGTSTAIMRIKELLQKPPHEPQHRWETAYVYAFLERFTTVQQDFAGAPQTIFEFETALLSGGPDIEPQNSDEAWQPSLEPVFKDFIARIRTADRNAGGTGGPKGGWHSWVPWWANEQRRQNSPDFPNHSWTKVFSTLKEDKNGIWRIDWDRRITILKALVDAQLCLCEGVRTSINQHYGHTTATVKKAADKEDKAAPKEKEEKPAVDTTADKPNAKSKGKPAASAKEKPAPAVNPVLITPLGIDARRNRWFRIDDSPRLYVNSKPFTARQAFVAVTHTLQDVETITKSLKMGKITDANGPFAKASKSNGSKKKKSGRTNWIEKEEQLQSRIAKDVLAPLQAEESTYFAKASRFENRRNNILRKKERDARQAFLAAERAAAMHETRSYGASGSTRTSTRLRTSTRTAATNGYDEAAMDSDLDRAIRDSERAYRKRRRGSDDEGEMSEPDFVGAGRRGSHGQYAGMDLNSEDDEEYDELASDSDDGRKIDVQTSKRSVRGATNGRASTNGRGHIPGERRSQRASARQNDSRDSSPEYSGNHNASVRRRGEPEIVRRASPEKPAEEFHHDYEEIWSKNTYKGYWYGGKFVPAKKGDVPLYKLLRMGLPFPVPDVSGDANSTDQTVPTLNNSVDSLPTSAVPTLEMETDTVEEDEEAKDSDVIKSENYAAGRESSVPLVVVASRSSNGTSSRKVDNGRHLSRHSDEEEDELDGGDDEPPKKVLSSGNSASRIEVVIPKRTIVPA